MKLKSLTAHPPYGFQFLQPETGQINPFTGSFNFVCQELYRLRTANPFLCERHGWRTDMPGIEHDVEQYNVARMVAGGYMDFVIQDGAPAVPSEYTFPPAQKKTPAVALGSIKHVAAGVAVLLEWLGNGAKPVDVALAESRAATCADCPKNDGGDFTRYFTEPIANKIRTQLEIRGDLQLRTPHDEQLTVCSACSCPLKLKVWVPMQHIMANQSEDTKTKLDPRCWILKGT